MQRVQFPRFIMHHYRHFTTAMLVDTAKAYETHLLEGGKMLFSLGGAISTAEGEVIITK